MKRKKWLWLFTCCLLLALLYLSWSNIGGRNASAAILSENEAKTLVQDRYQGTVTDIKLANNYYKIKLKKQNYIYTVNLDAKNGRVTSFIKQSAKVTLPNQKPSVNTSKNLTEADARKIAVNQVQGTIHTIHLESRNEIPFYLVEVVTENGEEAVIQIHAITGNVMSVTWDDKHGKDNKTESPKNEDHDD